MVAVGLLMVLACVKVVILQRFASTEGDRTKTVAVRLLMALGIHAFVAELRYIAESPQPD